jgi:hypothetical protein
MPLAISQPFKERKVLKPTTGIKIWKNPKNRFTVFELHYTADPVKRTEEWKARNKAGIPRRKWEQEYELRWESWAGKPVYGDWNQTAHGVDKEIDPILGLPLLRGWDFGLTPACVIAQLEKNTLHILKEFTSYNTGIDRFSDEVLAYCKMFYPAWADFRVDWLEFYDPAGNKGAETNAVSCANILKSKGLRASPGAVDFESRRSSVEHFLTRRNADGQCFQICESKCPSLVRGFNGGYRYPDEKNVSEIEVNRIKPIKDEYSHPHDALQYLTSGILRGGNRVRVEIPTPYYSWAGRR